MKNDFELKTSYKFFPITGFTRKVIFGFSRKKIKQSSSAARNSG